MYYGSEINEGKDPTENISHSSGCRRADGRGRFAYDLHEMLGVWWPGLGRQKEDRGSNVGVCHHPSHLPVLSRERTHFCLSYRPAFAHADPSARKAGPTQLLSRTKTLTIATV